MKKHYLLSYPAVFAALLLGSCSSSSGTDGAVTSGTPATEAPAMNMGRGIDLANLDTTANPCEDFYQYANGGWLANNPIPASESRWGSFNELADKNNAVLRELLLEASSNTTAPKGSAAQLIGDYYAVGMDSVAANQAGIKPIQPELDKIKSIKTTDDLIKTVADLKTKGISGFFSMYVSQDDKVSTQYALQAGQGGLGLPDRDYYLKDDERSKTIRTAYQEHLRNTFQLLGDDAAAAQKKAQTVMRIETKLAEASKARVDLRDPYANYNKMTIQEFAKQNPNLKISQMLTNMGATAAKEIIVGQPAFFKELNAMLKSVPVEDWKTYTRWHLARTMAPYLSQDFVQENFNFYGKVLSGAKEMQPRWKRVLRATDSALGEALGQLYVEKTFSPEAKQKAITMVNNLQEAFKEHVRDLEWMSDETKQRALQKLDAFAVKIGYPDKWEDYKGLDISRDSYAANVMRASQFAFRDNIGKIGKPVDREEWFMSPPTVNAYYNPSMNEIVFPAGILQPPFFDPNADDAVNYGGMGAVIGHELTHGFDDQGAKYDYQGNLKDWWSTADLEKFNARASAVADQYDQYTVLDNLHVNGRLTLGENIADIGGLNIAYTALQKALENNNPEKIAGLTPEQRFFLAWAQIWRVNMRDEAQNQQILTDPHSPGRFRTNGPLANMPQFYEAFGCEPSDPMVRSDQERIKIW
ncbi:M13 family metallopeptidase [Pontibacter akesuensis]|uniref:Endothelin-converting enzyme Metallo peptidase. MEROPS family M13 n=1 Tax=Pontibacter akesuensis TaxID=388950 RepID=A0A1I7JYE0_9BACT|nr:M13 family metallopeptidase [Pontibacter akesuensis]GHA76535.1 peptidase M13 [Pontibacter akesuensis]SFU90233.1 endothelin-converting enzyme Metallo peptidase. MEROPS family M13 [Pontibacter akesuensis]